MNTSSKLLAALLATVALAGCDRPTVVNAPPAVVVPTPVPGPAGPTGSTGSTGATGSMGTTGATGATGVIVVPAPAASEPK